jgi:Zn-dependent peptidase ImmA (M78 family)
MAQINRPKLEFEFIPGNHDQALGFGALRVWVGNVSIWSDVDGDGVSWTWIDLLEQLARSWPFLKYEENTPQGTYDGALSLLRNGYSATTEFEFGTPTESTEQEYIFVRRHNLATGIEGLYLPSFSLLREGRNVWVASANVKRLLSMDATFETLAQLGDALARQVSNGTPDERSQLALNEWCHREPMSEAVIQVSLGADLLMDIVPSGQTVSSYFETSIDSSNDSIIESSLLIAARMSEAVPMERRRWIIEQLRARKGKGISAKLAEISIEAQAQLPSYSDVPHKQAEPLAQWARRKFGIRQGERADPLHVLKDLGVEVIDLNFGLDAVDAVACWDQKHGPAVIVNRDGKHARSPGGRRATLAHELGHLLIDRMGSLPAAEVLGGNVPRYPEQRANAFAAEFLLPKAVAVEKLRKTDDKMSAINWLVEHFWVSRELAAWQILNSNQARSELDRQTDAELRTWTRTLSIGWLSEG